MLPQPVSNPNAPPSGTWPLFKLKGIQVYLHWSWIFVAIYHINKGKGGYSSVAWDIAEYVSLFVIVLMHEFGHAFATLQVGGRADQILLWPFGGIAYVDVPNRAKAYLWGIAAGPLVNAVLWPILYGVSLYFKQRFLNDSSEENFQLNLDLANFFESIYIINLGLLIFNLLPIFPMDGGQLLRGLLWLKLGSLRSLEIAAVIGVFLGCCLAGYALLGWRQTLAAFVMALMVSQAWRTLQSVRQAKAAMAKEPG